MRSLQTVGVSKTGADIAAVYAAKDANNLYLRLDLRDGPANTSFQNDVAGGSGMVGRYSFDLDFDGGGQSDLQIGILCSSPADRWIVLAWDPHHSMNHVAALESAAAVTTTGNTLEISLPVSGLGMPQQISLGLESSIFFYLSDVWIGDWDWIAGSGASNPPPASVTSIKLPDGTYMADPVSGAGRCGHHLGDGHRARDPDECETAERRQPVEQAGAGLPHDSIASGLRFCGACDRKYLSFFRVAFRP